MMADYHAAIVDFTEVIDKKLGSARAQDFGLRGITRCLLGSAKSTQGPSKEARKQYNLAREDFKKAIELEPNNAVHYQWQGLANAALGKAKEAIDDFEKAKQLEETKSGN